MSEIATEAPRAVIVPPQIAPRQGTAVRCVDLAIGYPDLTVASDIEVEIEHGQRAAIVGDNGQGKTTLLRTLVNSLEPKSGHVKWGHNCSIGVYAQHVYTTLDENDSVLEYLEQMALPGTTNQQILAVAGSLLFRNEHTQKKIKVLSGGERARLCMAGLLLGDYNILVLDEPGNHLDVETVESLANALLKYQGTVIFTSHDRHFMKRIASSIVEVRDGTAKNYIGDYDSYLYRVNQEISEGFRNQNQQSVGQSRFEDSQTPKPKGKTARRDQPDRKRQKQIQAIERKIKKLESDKKPLNEEMLQCSDPTKAMELHQQIQAIALEVTELEDRWLELTGEI